MSSSRALGSILEEVGHSVDGGGVALGLGGLDRIPGGAASSAAATDEANFEGPGRPGCERYVESDNGCPGGGSLHESAAGYIRLVFLAHKILLLKLVGCLFQIGDSTP